MGRKGRTGQFAGLSTRTRIPSAALVSAFALVAGLLYGAAVPSVAQAASSSGVTVTPAVSATARTVTLVTGDRVTVMSSDGHTSAQLVPAAGSGPAETYQQPGGDQYVVPAVAEPYLGRQLAPALFDVSALLRDGLGTAARIPVSVTYAAGVSPSAPPGITLTAVSGQSASGYLTPASTASFTAGLRASIGADVKAGRPAGSGPLFGGVTGVNLAAGTTIGAVSPRYPMHDVQIDETDTAGKPIAAAAVLFNDLDNLEAGYGNVPVDNGVGRVALPAGHYLATSLVFDFDVNGALAAIHWITDDEVTVPASGTVPTVKLSEAEATSAITVSTPRPSTERGLNVTLYDSDAAGHIAGTGILGFTTPTYVNPVAKPPVGWVRLQVSWSGVGPATGPAYRYDVAFSANDVPADESYVVRPDQVATVKQSYYADPADGTNGTLFNTVYDQTVNAVLAEGGFLITAGSPQTMPSTVTDYIGTADTGEWGQSIFTANFTTIQADIRTFTGGESTAISWLHGPLAPVIGQHTGPQFCQVCTAGASLILGFDPVGDSAPDHAGYFLGATNDDFILYRNGVIVFSGAADGVESGNLNTAPATYRAVYTRDASGAAGVSQSADVLTDLTVDSATSLALPSEDSCYGQSATAPCRLLPALTLDYRLDTDQTNTSDQPIELLQLGVGHVGFDRVESHAAITSAAVSVSFDGGKTWQQATTTGSGGRYIAAWDNPTSAKGTSPELKVSATDAVGGSITQTIVDAYTIAK
ncbi:hypothetical protein [Actinospica sp.]|jgi:hypothetical protein|uniref:hypothetical protein n=1 Tax=Actinospica sp. TaxID=1872142 RepID=UPI002B9EBD72|nr:hypothetical protein [Actinospica sp.]HWG28787.1 hypothetical protein [Actinospica sp.]